jgi:hypothetical protein
MLQCIGIVDETTASSTIMSIGLLKCGNGLLAPERRNVMVHYFYQSNIQDFNVELSCLVLGYRMW